MGLFGWLAGESTLLGWDAVKDRGKRRAPRRYVYSQDTHLPGLYRDRMLATTLDAQRNFGVCAWMVRKHLDYVASFSFQADTPDDDFNNQLERYIAAKGKACDVRGRHPLRRFIRLVESTRCLMGDVLIQRLNNGPYRGKVQAIEPDLIRIPDNMPGGAEAMKKFQDPSWVNGVHLDKYGRATEYVVSRRSERGGYDFERYIPAEEAILCGYFDRFDQVRGISPLSASLNSMADFYETSEMAYMKIKLASSFGLVTYRDSMDPLPGTTATTDSDGDGLLDSGHEVDLGGGPWSLEFGTEDKAEILESKSPPTEMVNFLQMSVDLIIKSLDLPLAFFDESKPTFHGGQASLKNYDRACKEKREDLREVLGELTDWWIGMGIADGEIILPDGMQPDDISFEWIPSGQPYWNQEKELRSEIEAIAAGLDNPIDAAKRHGRDFRTNVDRILQAQEYADAKGVKISFTQQSAPQPVAEAVPDEDTEDEAELETAEVVNDEE